MDIVKNMYKICNDYLYIETGSIQDCDEFSRTMDNPLSRLQILENQFDDLNNRVRKLEREKEEFMAENENGIPSSFVAKVTKKRGNRSAKTYTLTIARRINRSDLENMSMLYVFYVFIST